MPKLLAEAEEQLLWKSIQDESGEDSLWLTHFEEAAAIFRRELIAIGNLHPPTSSQLRGWLERSAARHADPPCRTRDLLTRGPKSCNIHRAGADVTGKVPENPTSIQSPHPSPAGQPKNSSQHRQKKAERRSRHQAAVNKIGNEGLVSGSPCARCVKAKRDCLVHPDYPRCQSCTRCRLAARGCQAGGTRGYHSEQAHSPYRDTQNQER